MVRIVFTFICKILSLDLFSGIFRGSQILLPRPPGQQVNTSFLDLGNYSTVTIDLPSADTTLVLKVQ